MKTLLHKRGDTFLISAVVKIGGETQDITLWDIKSQLRREDDPAFLVELVIERIDNTQGTYMVRCDDTTAWPIGQLQWDVQYTTDTDQVISTQTVIVDVRKDVTRP